MKYRREKYKKSSLNSNFAQSNGFAKHHALSVNVNKNRSIKTTRSGFKVCSLFI